MDKIRYNEQLKKPIKTSKTDLSTVKIDIYLCYHFKKMYIKFNISMNVQILPNFSLGCIVLLPYRTLVLSKISLIPHHKSFRTPFLGILPSQNAYCPSQHLVLSALVRIYISINLGRRNYYKCECIRSANWNVTVF
jgi:hypothetical protein